MFTDPELARVGLNESEAKSRGINYRSVKMPMAAVLRTRTLSEPRGFIKAIVDANSGEILGGVVLSIEGGEMMAQLQLAMMGKLHYQTLRDAIFAHPTLAEAWNNLFSTLN